MALLYSRGVSVATIRVSGFSGRPCLVFYFDVLGRKPMMTVFFAKDPLPRFVNAVAPSFRSLSKQALNETLLRMLDDSDGSPSFVASG